MRFGRKFVKFLAGVLVVIGLLCSYLWDQYTVPIMMYHHISDEPSEIETTSPRNFEWQMEFLIKNNYRILRFGELIDLIAAGKPLPRKSVVVTLDDGFEDNYFNALPILKEKKIPAMFFLVHDYIGKEGFMTWEQVKELQAAQMDIGSHSMTHAYFPTLSVPELRWEISESKRLLEEKLKTKIEYIAYPIGGFTPQAEALVRAAGYKAAATTNRGYDRFDRDVDEIGRIRFSNKEESEFVLWVKLCGYYNLLRKLKKPY